MYGDCWHCAQKLKTKSGHGDNERERERREEEEEERGHTDRQWPSSAGRRPSGHSR